MAKNTDISLGSDVQVIREILFGEQLQSIQEQIRELEKKISNLQKENNQLRKALDAETQQREHDKQTSGENLANASQQFQNQLSSLGEELKNTITHQGQDSTKSLEDLDHKYDERLKGLMDDIAQQKADHDILHDNLVTSLATALLEYRQAPVDGGSS